MSKFEHDIFYDDDGAYYAVSKERYTLEEAEGLAKLNLNCGEVRLLEEYVSVRHRAGVTFDGYKQVGWYVECEQRPRSCPAWVFEAVDA